MSNQKNGSESQEERYHVNMTNGSSFIPPTAHHISYDLSSNDGFEGTISQPSTTPIAHVISTFEENAGKLVDCNDGYIAYAIKNGLVRVIDRQTGKRALLRGHSGKEHFVKDVAFFSQTSDILASVGPTAISSNTNSISTSSCILIWKMIVSEDTNNALSEECLLQLSSSPSSSTAERILWHPYNTNFFLVIHGKAATLIETTKLTTVQPLPSSTTKPRALCNLYDSTPGSSSSSNSGNGQTLLDGHLAKVTDACWSTIHPQHIFTSGEDGQVKLWDTTLHSTGGLQRAACLWSIQEKESITKCICLPPLLFGNTTTTTTLLIATRNNSRLTLYSSSQQQHLTAPPKEKHPVALPPRKTQVLDLINTARDSKSSYFHVAVCKPPHISSFSSDGVFIVVADTSSPKMYVLHAGVTVTLTEKDAGSPSLSPYHYSYALCKVTPFQLLYPIVSWSVRSLHQQENDNDIRIVEEGEENSATSAWDIACHVVQTTAVQTLRIHSNLCKVSSNTLAQMMKMPPSTNLSHLTPGRGVHVIADMIEEEKQGKRSDIPVESFPNTDEESYELDEEEEEPLTLEDVEDQEEDNEERAEQPSQITSMATTNASPFDNWLGAIVASSSLVGTATQSKPKQEIGINLNKQDKPQQEEVVVEKKPDGKASKRPKEAVVADTGFNSNTSSAHSITSTSSSKLLSPDDMMSFRDENSKKDGAKVQIVQARAVNSSPVPAPKGGHQQIAPGKGKSTTPSRKSKTPPVAARPKYPQNPSSKKKVDEQPQQPSGTSLLGATPIQLKILKRSDNSALELENTPAASTSAAVAINEPFTSTASYTETFETLPISFFEEKITKVLSSHAKTQSQLIRDVVKDEVSNRITTSMKSMMEAHQEALCKEVPAVLSSTVKESVTKAFYDTMRKVMIPAYEATTQNIFEQIAATVESNIKATSQREQQVQSEMANQMTAMSQNMVVMMQAIDSLTQEVTQLRTVVAEFSIAAASQIDGSRNESVSQDEVDSFLELKEEIMNLLSKEKYDEAFTKALSANNAEITEFCCRQADLSLLCAKDPPVLSQLILLCVMQQLGSLLLPSRNSSDLLNELSWLQDIAVTLNPSHPTIEQHVGLVISQLTDRIHTMLKKGDIQQLKRPLQTLLQVLRGTRVV